jgi:response regulator RpfG family c-di-GMP phosphodiesterase
VSAIADRPSVLIVDDERMIRELLGDVFTAGGYQCRLASNGVEAIEAFQAERPALSITDVRMPVLDGLGFLKQARTLDPDAAVLVLTGVGDVQTAVDVLNGGAYDFIQKPVDPEHLLLTAGRALEHRQLVIERRQHQELLERRVAEATGELAATVRDLEEAYRVTLEALGSAIDTRDVGTHAHSRRVRGYSLAIARAHGMPESQMPDIEHGVMLHDIGKIGIPDAILLKPGPLTPEEWKVMRSHPEIGRRIVEKIPFLHGAVAIVYNHHERWDGTGYPQGLRGEEIPLGPRIFALADALDAMTFDRPYSSAISFETARDEIKRCAGAHFDPAVVNTFLTIPLQTFADIRHRSLHDVSAADAAAEAVRAALGNSGPILESALLV